MKIPFPAPPIHGGRQAPEHVAARVASRKANNPAPLPKPISKQPGSISRRIVRDRGDEIVSKYLDGASASQLAREYGLAVQTVLNAVLKAGFTTRTDFGSGARGKGGPDHHAWKGGRTDNGNGYVLIRVGSKYELEHRIVMASVLGRPMTADESVHHRNGIKNDNRPENLELRARYHGKGATNHCPTCTCVTVVETL